MPPDICGLRAFEQWRKKAEGTNPELLYLDRQTLVESGHEREAEAQFPKSLEWQGTEYRLHYRFEPGHPEDGVTIDIPIALLHQAPVYRFQWLVPGLLRDKCIALVKGLAKPLRKQFVPVPDYVDRALAGAEPQNRPLGAVLGEQLKRHTGVEIPEDSWDESGLEDFYRANFLLLDENRKPLASGRNLEKLRDRYRDQVQATIQEAADDAQVREGIVCWDFGDLPERQRLRRKDLEINVYPALVDRGASVALQPMDTAVEAERLTRDGLVRLAMLVHGQPAKFLTRDLFKGRELQLVAAGLGDRESLVADVIWAAYGSALLPGTGVIRTRADFEAALNRARGEIVPIARHYEKSLAALTGSLKAVNEWLAKRREAYPEVVENIERQLAFLFRPGFLAATDDFWLRQYPRYIQAAEVRLEKLPAQVDRNRAIIGETGTMLDEIDSLMAKERVLSADVRREIETYHFMIEEYRVSVFAQVLKTALPVSTKRIRKQYGVIADRLRA